MSDLMWATTKDGTSIHFGFGHKCHKHNTMFNLEHIRTCSEISGCQDIAKYAKRIKEGDNIRLWKQEDLADAIVQYTQLAVQLANLTARSMATLVHTPTKKKPPTGGKRGRPTAVAKIARDNNKIDTYYRIMAPAPSADRPMSHPEEVKEQSLPSGPA